MANKYPYVASPGPLAKTVEHLRKHRIPKELNADTLRKLGVAPKNESYVINVLQFLGIIDGEGKTVEEKTKPFIQHKNEEFQKEFEQIVREAYAELFELYGDDAWARTRDDLTHFFRNSDHSSQIVGSRQAGTFSYLSALAGKGDLPQTRDTSPRRTNSTKTKDARSPASKAAQPEKAHENRSTPFQSSKHTDHHFGLTVRVEVNLPADGDQQTYDRIFRSIRKNLIDGDSA